jgi:peptide/nickel transport system substrate-binding protein
MVFTSVVPHEAVQYYGEDFGRHPVGSGPFGFHRWLSEQQIELRRHFGYGLDLNGRRLPYLDGALIRFLGSPDVELLEFQAGTLDLVHSISASAFPNIVENGIRVRAAFRNHRVLATENFGTELLGVNMQHPLLGTNRKLRQALALAFDREALTEVLLSGRAIPATGLVPKMSVVPYGPRTESGAHNPLRARQLLDDAGFPGGKGLPVFRLLFNASPTVERLVTYLQAALAEIGIPIRLLPMQFSEFLERLQSGDFDLYRDHLAADHAAADAFFGYFYGPYSAPQSINITRFQDADYDSLFDRLQRQSLEVQRSRLQTQLQVRLDREVPAVFLFHPLRFRLQLRRLRNLPMSPLGQLDLRNAWIDAE